jgi:hypothetical protein
MTASIDTTKTNASYLRKYTEIEKDPGLYHIFKWRRNQFFKIASSSE